MKHMSQSVHASTMLGKSAEETPSISPLSDSSTKSNKRGKESHRLKQRRQPWHISNTRRISASSSSVSKNFGSRQAMGWRVGAPGSASILLACQVMPSKRHYGGSSSLVAESPAVLNSEVIKAYPMLFGSVRHETFQPWPVSRTNRQSHQSLRRGQCAPCPDTYPYIHEFHRQRRRLDS